jgi:hypothetical protein
MAYVLYTFYAEYPDNSLLEVMDYIALPCRHSGTTADQSFVASVVIKM